jgi:acetoin utilization deacetylase AcuC-like enzyme
MGQLIHKYFAETSIIITQEGGYDMEAVPDIVCRFLKYLSTENNR